MVLSGMGPWCGASEPEWPPTIWHHRKLLAFGQVSGVSARDDGRRETARVLVDRVVPEALLGAGGAVRDLQRHAGRKVRGSHVRTLRGEHLEAPVRRSSGVGSPRIRPALLGDGLTGRNLQRCAIGGVAAGHLEYGSFQARESLFAGPGGFIKFESTWQVLEGGQFRFTTAIPFGGP